MNQRKCWQRKYKLKYTDVINMTIHKDYIKDIGSVGFLVDIEVKPGKGYHVDMYFNRRVYYGRIAYPLGHPLS